MTVNVTILLSNSIYAVFVLDGVIDVSIHTQVDLTGNRNLTVVLLPHNYTCLLHFQQIFFTVNKSDN